MLAKTTKKNLPLDQFKDLEAILKEEKKASFFWEYSVLVKLWPSCVNYSVFDDKTGEWITLVIGQDLGLSFEILLLLTRPQKKRAYFMKNLLAEILTELHLNKKEEVWLEVHESNLAARNLYKKLGFVEVGTRPNYYSDGGNAILCSFFLKNE